jgi:hypothetical protein
MSERTFKINIKSLADTSGLALTQKETEKLASFVQRLDQDYEQLNASMSSGATEQAAGQMGQLTGHSNAASQAVTRAGKSSGNSALAVLELSRALEDAQYGIRGVLNNIPGLITMLGGGAGLAGVISIAAVAITQLWERFGGAKEAAEDVKDVEAAAAALEARLTSLSAAMSARFGVALDEQRDKLKAFLAEWQEATKNLGQSYAALDEQVQSRLDNDLARLEVEKEAALAGAGSPEEQAEIEADFKGRADSLTGQARQESAGLKVDRARQEEEQAAEGIKRADQAKRDAVRQINEADEAVKESQRRIFGAGVDSDQDRAVSAFDEAKSEWQLATEKRDEERQKKALAKMKNLGPAAQTARQELAEGVKTYEDARADEALPADQRKVLADEEAQIEMSRKQREEALKNFRDAEASKAAASEAYGKAKRNTAQALDNQDTEEMRQTAAQMREQRTSAPVDTEKIDAAAQAAEAAAQEVGKSAEQLATSTADSSNQIAGDLRQLTESVGSALTGIQAAVADNSRAISALAQRTESAAAMASAALAAANDTRANSRAFNGGRR